MHLVNIWTDKYALPQSALKHKHYPHCLFCNRKYIKRLGCLFCQEKLKRKKKKTRDYTIVFPAPDTGAKSKRTLELEKEFTLKYKKHLKLT